MAEVDVVIVGAGNAALCAALSAREQGASVVVLERASEDEGGGNTRFTAGAIRTVYNGVEDLRALMPDLTDEEVAITDFGTYTQDQFFDDMFRVTQYRCDADLAEKLVTRSYDTASPPFDRLRAIKTTRSPFRPERLIPPLPPGSDRRPGR